MRTSRRRSLSFNVGVELGQLFVLALAVPALALLFKHVVAERMGTIILSAFVAHTAWHWMLERGAVLRQYPVHLPAFDADVRGERDAGAHAAARRWRGRVGHDRAAIAARSTRGSAPRSGAAEPRRTGAVVIVFAGGATRRRRVHLLPRWPTGPGSAQTAQHGHEADSALRPRHAGADGPSTLERRLHRRAGRSRARTCTSGTLPLLPLADVAHRRDVRAVVAREAVV